MKLKYLKPLFFMFGTVVLSSPEITRATDSVAEICVKVPVGEDEDSVGYSEYSACPEGPKDFYVYQGNVYILDSEKDRILVFRDGVQKDCIELGAYCNMMEILEDKIYVLAYVKREILEFSLDGEKQRSYSLGCDSSWVKGIAKDGGKIAIITNSEQTLNYRDPYSGFSIIQKNAETLKDSSYAAKEYLVEDIRITEYFTDVSSNYAVLHRYNNQTDHFIGEEYIVYIDGGDIKGYSKVDSEKWEVLPARYFREVDGIPYLMCCYADHVVIRQVSFSETMEDSMFDHIEMIQEEIAAQKEDLDKDNDIVKISEKKDKISLSREQVLFRAQDMSSIYWNLTEEHKKTRTSAKLPKCISDAPAGRSFQGIPYCWGGFFGVSDTPTEISYGGKFSDKIDTVFSDGTMYMAGNIQSRTAQGDRQGHVSKTIGVDCSGFVSSAYGLSRKQSTSDLISTNNYYAVEDLKNLKMCDILVSSTEGHVYLFTGMKDEKTYVVYDCNSNSETGKVLKREITAEHLKNYNYVGRSPWAD